MNADRFIALLATSLGLLGSLFMARGVLQMSPDIIVKLSGTYWGFNSHEIKSLASQRADLMAGIEILIIAFCIQLLSLSRKIDEKPIFESLRQGLIINFSLVFLFGLGTSFISRFNANRYETQAKTILVQNEFSSFSKDGKITARECLDFIGFARARLNIEGLPEDPSLESFEKCCQLSDIEIPPNLDLSEITQSKPTP